MQKSRLWVKCDQCTTRVWAAPPTALTDTWFPLPPMKHCACLATGGSDREMLATGMANPNLVPNADPNDVRLVVLGALDWA